MKVSITSEEFERGKRGYRVSVLAEDASVQDYLDALNQGILSLELFRARGIQGDHCKGCEACCAERMPLTPIDLKVLAQCPSVMEWISNRGLGPDDEEQLLMALVRRFCRVYVKGSTVDITLRLGEDGKCPFLDPGAGTCSIYDFRPLVCQAYICCPASQEAFDLREAVVNAGEDELVRLWLSHAREHSLDFWYHEADNPQVDPEDWKTGPYTGKDSYSQILIKELVTPELWDKLIAGN